jgi:hypothetical protein
VHLGLGLETGAAALALAVVFVLGGRLRPLHIFAHERRSLISFAAGASAAYVFVRLMPELAGVRDAFLRDAVFRLSFEGKEIYVLALVGFLVFYGLDHWRKRVDSGVGSGHRHLGFALHIGGFAAYSALVGYLLVDNLDESARSTALYALAMALHFLTVDYTLRREHGPLYQSYGRFLLAGACVTGWAAGLLVSLPAGFLGPMMAFLSGAVIMNSTITELPAERDGRFLPFLVGGILYSLLLLPLS